MICLKNDNEVHHADMNTEGRASQALLAKTAANGIQTLACTNEMYSGSRLQQSLYSQPSI